MSDLINRQAAIDTICKVCPLIEDYHKCDGYPETSTWCDELVALRALPSARPTLRERALMLLLNWAVECDFGYDNFPEKYEQYKNEIEDMDYFDGMIYIAEKEVE